MAQVWEKENKKMLDLKLLLYAEHPGWHESMVLSVSHDSGQLDCSRLQKGTLVKDLNVRPIRQGLSQRNHQTTVCGNKTGPLSEDNSGTEPRVQHLAQLTGMLLALASGLESGGVLWGKSIGRDYSSGSSEWAIGEKFPEWLPIRMATYKNGYL